MTMTDDDLDPAELLDELIPLLMAGPAYNDAPAGQLPRRVRLVVDMDAGLYLKLGTWHGSRLPYSMWTIIEDALGFLPLGSHEKAVRAVMEKLVILTDLRPPHASRKAR
jgi:hypothetical protein